MNISNQTTEQIRKMLIGTYTNKMAEYDSQLDATEDAEEFKTILMAKAVDEVVLNALKAYSLPKAMAQCEQKAQEGHHD